MSEAELLRQFRVAESYGWLSVFREEPYGVPAAILLGIASRETGMRNILGDSGHGHGLMQIDDRSFPEFCRSPKWKDGKENIKFGAFVLRSKYNDAKARGVPTKDLMRVALASYNAGRAAIVDYNVHRNPDRRTTGHDYSADVLRRAAIFQRFLPNEKAPPAAGGRRLLAKLASAFGLA